MEWVITNILARSSRPGYNRREVGQSTVDQWIVEAREMGIRTIICLLSDAQLEYYNQIPGGLLAYYEAAGFNVRSVMIEDYQNPPVSEAEMEAVRVAYDGLERPVLVHCSAGVDRTGAVVKVLQDL